MRILLINPPHPSIGSRIPREHLPPLGLLSVGGPLLDAGHQVRLLDAEFGPMSTSEILEQAASFAPDAILLGHSGSTSGHPIVAEIVRTVHQALPKAWIVYGGIFPTYHWQEILADVPQIDVIVRGEGEETAPRVIHALETRAPLNDVTGIAYRKQGRPVATPPAPLIRDLDAFRVGWELADLSRYSYWGDRRAVVAQFSRGCLHRCSYCGQCRFWKRWRHRDPQKFAAELAWLHRTHGVEVINFADENPTASRAAWRAFLEALIAENVPLTLVGSTRADDIVRDADILYLYKEAGVARFLLGIESYDEETLREIRKGSTTATDREAIRLLRQHDILSMATYVVGFEEESHRDYWRGLRQLRAYDPDQIQMLYVTPHRWTPYFRAAAARRVIQTDQRKWDYKHQVLATRHMPPWLVLTWVKFIEAVMQLRPRALWRLLTHPDLPIRDAMRWYYRIGRRVWPFEIWHFFFQDRPRQDGPTLAEFWRVPQSRAEGVTNSLSALQNGERQNMMMETSTAVSFALVQTGLAAVEARLREAVAGQHPSLTAATARLLTAGGKRLRPAMALLTAGVFSADDARSVALAAAVEMLHTATLVHDDLIDRSLLRRGAPTLNADCSPDAVVLTGDYLFACAADLGAQADSPAVMCLFARTLMAIVNGEIAQKCSTGVISRAAYYERIYAKTAALFALATEAAAMLGNADAAGVAAAREFGRAAGMAFQIVDDVLDFIGDPARMGKPVGGDLRQGVVTLPAIYYVESHPDDSDVGALHAGRAAHDGVISRVVAAVCASDAIAQAQQAACAFAEQAQLALTRFPDSPCTEALSALPDYIVKRNL